MCKSIEETLNKYNLTFELVEPGHYKILSDTKVDMYKLMYELKNYTILFRDESSDEDVYQLYAIIKDNMDSERQYNIMLEYTKSYPNVCVMNTPGVYEDSIDTVLEGSEIYAE